MTNAWLVIIFCMSKYISWTPALHCNIYKWSSHCYFYDITEHLPSSVIISVWTWRHSSLINLITGHQISLKWITWTKAFQGIMHSVNFSKGKKWFLSSCTKYDQGRDTINVFVILFQNCWFNINFTVSQCRVLQFLCLTGRAKIVNLLHVAVVLPGKDERLKAGMVKRYGGREKRIKVYRARQR